MEVADLDEVMRLHTSLAGEPPRGVVEVVPAARTVLVRYDPALTTPVDLAADLRGRRLGPVDRSVARRVEVPVTYDGADLAEVARLTGLAVGDVVARHRAVEYVVAFIGFAPGFAYLVGGDPALVVPRRETPRTRVPTGSVGLAGEFTGIYPRESPGGWQLVGRTDAVLWDLDRDPPALLTPGTRVRFVEVSS